jgi:ATP-dependent Clp protease ATP-binding subunit ClpC
VSEYYQGALEETRDLVAEHEAGRLPVVGFRQREIAEVLEHLDAGRSVLLTGPVGAGKTAVVYGVAGALAGRGEAGAVRGLRQISSTEILSGTKFLGEWQSKLARLVEGAADTQAALFVTDVWNLATVGRTSTDPSGVLDALRPALDSRRVAIIGEADPAVLRQMQRVSGFVNLFAQVRIPPLDADQVDELLEMRAADGGLRLDPACRTLLVSLTSRFLPSRPQPGPALQLLDRVRDYQEQKRAVGELEPVSAAFIEKVFSIYTGLPRFVVSRAETVPARDIRAWFEDRIVGQREAIEAVVETIALYKAGLHDPQRPIGTFLFVGPTGVGKTELARALAEFLFGSASRLLRFDLSEFKDYHSFEMLVGDPGRADQPARLVDPVRAHPFQVVLFDELEKAHSNVWDLFLQLLDEGRLTPPAGEAVSFRNTIIIATSNVGAQTSDKAVGFGARADDGARAAAIRDALEKAFRPELLNRFGHVVVFHPLSAEQVRTVARQELRRVLGREGITGRNLVVDVDDAALDLIIERGFDPRYGARGLKREIQRQLVLPLAMTLMERQVDPGAILKVSDRDGKINVRLIDTAESREHRREREPVRVADKKMTRDEIAEVARKLAADVEALAAEVDEPWLRTERGRLLEMRRDPAFWNHPEDAALALRDLDRYGAWLHRLDRLRQRADEIASGIADADMRREVADLGNRLVQLEDSIAVTRRELVAMGAAGLWDALVEIRPLPEGGRRARDLLHDTYRRWAEDRRMEVEVLREPLDDDEPVMLAIKGHYAYGLLRLEAGMHRVRDGKHRSVAAVRVGAWTDRREPVEFHSHRALKVSGQYGGRVRSRLECAGGLVLQNGATLADNRERAAELAPSWTAAPQPPDDIVRRYDLDPPMIRDVATGVSSGRTDALAPRPLHDLLCRRVDELGQSERR